MQRVSLPILLLDGFTMLPQSGCLLWSSYLSSPLVCWWPLQSSRNFVTLWTGSWWILLLLILERPFLPALSVYAISFMVTSFWDTQCASLMATLSQFVVSGHSFFLLDGKVGKRRCKITLSILLPYTGITALWSLTIISWERWIVVCKRFGNRPYKHLNALRNSKTYTVELTQNPTEVDIVSLMYGGLIGW